MASPHLIRKIRKAALVADIRLKNRSVLLHHINGKIVRCSACWIEEGEPKHQYIQVALRAHKSADDLVHTVIHELLHCLGYNEEAVEGGLDDAAFKSRALRETVAKRLIGLLAGYDKGVPA